jgi:hypothetical protein
VWYTALLGPSSISLQPQQAVNDMVMNNISAQVQCFFQVVDSANLLIMNQYKKHSSGVE